MQTSILPNKMLTLILALSLSLSGLLKLSAQSIRQQVSFTEKTISYAKVNPNDLQRISEIEMADLTTKQEERQVVMVMDQFNDITTTSTIIKAPAQDAWINPVHKIISDKTGAKLYDRNNQLLGSSLITDEFNSNYQQMKQIAGEKGLFNPPTFAPLSTETISNLRNSGVEVSQLPEGQYQLSKGNVQFIYAPERHTTTMTLLENGKSVYEKVTSYTEIAGSLSPSYKIERNFKTLSNGICVEYVTVTTYTNYTKTPLLR